MNIRKIYDYALAREYEGKHFFESNSNRMSHAAARGISEVLAEEEGKHVKSIPGLLCALDRDQDESIAFADLDERDRFALRADSEILEQTVVESTIPDVAVLSMACLIEPDSAEFYEAAARRSDGQPKAALDMLARWERGHERLFHDLHDRVFKEYAGGPWGG